MAEKLKYTKRAEDFSYAFKRIDSKNFNLLSTFFQDLEENEGKVEYLRWKYLNSPAESVLLVAQDGFTNRVIGFQGAVRVDGSNGKRPYLLTDSAVEPNHRKRGIIRRLIQQCQTELGEQSQLIASSASVSEAVLQKCNLTPTHELRVYVKPDVACHFSSKSEFDRTKLFASRASKVVEQGWRPDKYKSRDILAWICKNPSVEHLIIGDKDSANNYVLFRIIGAVIHILEWQFDNREVASEIMDLLNGEVVRKGFQKMVCFCPEDSQDEKWAKQFGFLHKPLVIGPYRDSWKLFSSNADMQYRMSHFLMQDWNPYFEEQ